MIRSSQRLLNSVASVARQEVTKWDIYASVAICRLPVIAPNLNPIQEKFVEMQQEIEHQNSYKSDFELRKLKDEEYVLCFFG